MLKETQLTLICCCSDIPDQRLGSVGAIYPQHEYPVTGQNTRVFLWFTCCCLACLLAAIKHCLTLRQFLSLEKKSLIVTKSNSCPPGLANARVLKSSFKPMTSCLPSSRGGTGAPDVAHLQCRRRNPSFVENLPQTRDVQGHHLSLGTSEPELRQHRARLRAEASHQGSQLLG